MLFANVRIIIMKFTSVFLFLSILSLIHSSHLSNNKLITITSMKQLVFNAFSATDPYQIILITNGTTEYAYFLANDVKMLIIQDFPTVTIDYESIDVLDSITKSGTDFFRHSALFIVMYFQSQRNNITDIEILQNKYVELFPKSPRPKWLIFMLAQNSDEDYDISLVLQESWKNKFIDITIAEVILSDVGLDSIVLHSYNPFQNELLRQNYHSDIRIFPDKLRNMNGYRLSTIFYEDPPGVKIIEEAGVSKISGTDYLMIETIAHVLNFTLKIIDSGLFNFTGILNALQYDNIDFTGNQIYFWDDLPFDKSMILKPDGYCVVVPILEVPSVRAKSRIYFGMFLTLLYALTITNASKLLKYDRKMWTWINIFQVILGMSAPKLPRTLGERSLIGCVIILSLTYTSVFYARMTDNNLKSREEVPLNNFKDLDESGLIPLVHKDVYNNTFDVFDIRSDVMKNLKRKTRIWNNMISCVDELSKNNTIACIMSEQLGEYLINKYKDNEGMLTMRVMQPCFWITWRGNAFAPGSPYQESFDRIMVRIFESGLVNNWIEHDQAKSSQKKTLTLDTGFILTHMSAILTAGYFLSFLTLLVELMIYYLLS